MSQRRAARETEWHLSESITNLSDSLMIFAIYDHVCLCMHQINSKQRQPKSSPISDGEFIARVSWIPEI